MLDASVGVKWFRDENGSVEARELIERHIEGELVLVVDSLFLHEVLAAASRTYEKDDVTRIWSDLKRLDLVVVPLGDDIVAAASIARAALHCSLYDAFSAGLATLLEAPLFSADARAHALHEGVVLLGG